MTVRMTRLPWKGMSVSDDTRLIYSTDPAQNLRCPRCTELAAACICRASSEPIDKHKIRPVLRIEKAHRCGKEVTVIDRLPASESFLRDLAQALKRKCGCGGTFRIDGNSGIVEIQGNKRVQIQAELARMEIGRR